MKKKHQVQSSSTTNQRSLQQNPSSQFVESYTSFGFSIRIISLGGAQHNLSSVCVRAQYLPERTSCNIPDSNKSLHGVSRTTCIVLPTHLVFYWMAMDFESHGVNHIEPRICEVYALQGPILVKLELCFEVRWGSQAICDALIIWGIGTLLHHFKAN